jgi:hypothetical protein
MKYLFIFFMLFGQLSYGQDCLCDSLFGLLKKEVQIQLPTSKFVFSWHDEMRISFYTLMANCPVKCLTQYVDDSIAAIRVNIFDGLMQKNADHRLLKSIQQRYKNDTTKYIIRSADVVQIWTVGEYMKTFLKIYSNKKNTFEPVDFQVRLEELQKRIRETPRVVIPGASHGMISKEDLLKVDSLVCSIETHQVISFTLMIGDRKFIGKDNFTPEMKDAARAMKTGERLFIDDIKVTFPNDSWGIISSLVLEIE